MEDIASINLPGVTLPKQKKNKADLKQTSDIQTPTVTPTKPQTKWWQKPPIQYAFCHPYVRTKLERLMGSNLVSLTDRDYMLRLQERILEDYANCMKKRINARKKDEMDRMKNLVLSGKIPLDQAPPEMANHPVMLIESYCNKLIAERRAKIKVPHIYIPTHLYWDDTPDPPSGLKIESGHMFRSGSDRLCTSPDHFLDCTDESDVEAGYMFTAEDYQRMKYESPLIKELRECQTVEEMYVLADKIIGVLKTLEDRQSTPAANNLL